MKISAVSVKWLRGSRFPLDTRVYMHAREKVPQVHAVQYLARPLLNPFVTIDSPR